MIVLGVNEVHKIPISSNATIGLDKKDHLLIKDQGQLLLIQGKKLGENLLRLGSTTYKVVVVSPKQHSIYGLLKTTLQYTQGLWLDFADGAFRIRGRLDHPSTWLTLSHQYLNSFYMEAEISADHLLLVEYEINKSLTKSGFFPIKIHQEPYPTVRLASNANQNHQVSEILGHYGLTLKEDNKKLYSEPLVRVQVLLAEVRKSFAQNIGIEWPYQASAQILPQGLLPSAEGSQLIANFFAKEGSGRILANPVLLAKSGSDAEFFAGGEFPIKSKTKQTQTVTWKKYGITLKIKPLADADGKISLDLSSEVSSIDSGERIDGIPSLFTNTLSSHFDLHGSQTIALSGLVKKIDGESLKRWPGLGDIPVLGNLFTSREYQEDKTELVVLVTPVIVDQN